ncbi:hypothetical protein B2J93_3635 [Marssonina coronariae]|uniref:Uncharacterized protein n=1 Tax=Diplocarpon coronariae TaxID=2795749 RepID=A0A218Z4M3_9HELO|nr:hypothetical protein JHW43_007718 [Diplocarpon mali]OWP03009.1 hypothetical protein B2J93_3635 [Marssonina coronariae]
MATIPFYEFSKAPGISSSPTRPKHLSTRPIPELSAPHSRRHHKHHHPHTHHRNDRDKGRDRDRERERKDVEGASKSEGHTPSESRVVSRRGSLGLDGLDGGVSVGGGIGWTRKWMEKERRVRDEEVEEERERGLLRAGELRSALASLASLSNTTTRRLDTTYYSVLEKVSALQSTISSLSELASLTRGLTEEFRTEAQELVADVSSQVEGFDGFEDQEEKIGELKQRVEKGREKIKSLGDRVEVVRDRVEGWEVREREWQDRTRRRLRALWVGFVVVVAMLGIGVAIQWTPGTRSQNQMNGVAMHGEDSPTNLLGKSPQLGVDQEVLKSENMRNSEGKRRIVEGTKEVEDDSRLRVFDEL